MAKRSCMWNCSQAILPSEKDLTGAVRLETDCVRFSPAATRPCPRTRGWHSRCASCAPRRRSAKRKSPIKCRCRTKCRDARTVGRNPDTRSQRPQPRDSVDVEAPGCKGGAIRDSPGRGLVGNGGGKRPSSRPPCISRGLKRDGMRAWTGSYSTVPDYRSPQAGGRRSR